MQVLDEKTKGFTLLEILVVVVIIGLISAIAFPNFSDWKKDREIRTVAEKVAPWEVFSSLYSSCVVGVWSKMSTSQCVLESNCC